MSKLFLTGGSGFIGKHIFEKWDGDLYLYTRDQSFDCLQDFEPDYIIHSAAEIYKEYEMFDSNILLTYRLLQKARHLKNLKAMIIIGSSSEYGLKDHPIKENEVLEPFHLYAGTKGSASLLALSYAHKYQLPIMIARPFSVYGKYEPKHRFIPTAIKCIKTQWELPVAPGSHDFIHIDDLLDGLFLMLKKPKVGSIYNLGTGKQYTNMQVVKIIEKITNKKMNYKKVPQMREFDTDCWVCDNSKAKKELNWEPKINLTWGLKQLCHRT